MPPNALLSPNSRSSRCHPWATLFPPVPAPKSHIKDFIVNINYEVTGVPHPASSRPGLGPGFRHRAPGPVSQGRVLAREAGGFSVALLCGWGFCCVSERSYSVSSVLSSQT